MYLNELRACRNSPDTCKLVAKDLGRHARGTLEGELLKLRRLLNFSSLTIGIAFALSAGASQFSMSSRVTLGPLNALLNKQEKTVANTDSSNVPRQLQRGIMNEQKMNVGMNQ